MTRIRTCGLTLAIFCLATGNAAAQSAAPDAGAYPSKPIRMVIPFPPGGGLDVLTRMVSQKLSESLGQPIIADNRPASDGVLAEDTVAKAVPDGYTLLTVSSSHAINPAIGKKLPYDTTKDFAPITQMASQALLLVVAPTLPAKSVRELIDLAKKTPGGLNFGSSSNATQLPAELFNVMAGIKMVHVPYKGAAPMITDIIGGHIQLSFGASSSVMPLVKSGRLVALATGDNRRSPLLPDVPTVAESGVPGYHAVIWSGMLAPAKTPPALIERLNREVVRVLNLPDIRDRMSNQLGLDPVGNSSAAWGQFIRAEISKWAKIAKMAGVKASD
jgi:tripartite-type tricarboxylate transporter receptor subunit TctC